MAVGAVASVSFHKALLLRVMNAIILYSHYKRAVETIFIPIQLINNKILSPWEGFEEINLPFLVHLKDRALNSRIRVQQTYHTCEIQDLGLFVTPPFRYF
jgi:hypothetical protein